MKTRILLIVFTVLFLGGNGIGQVDSTKLIETCKLHVLLDRANGIVDVGKFLQDGKCEIKFLNASGFSDLIFLAVHIYDLDSSRQIDTTNASPFSCEYVIGYNKKVNSTYLLKGFVKNDFESFYLYEIPNHYKHSPKGKLAHQSSLNDYFIEHIDLVCLYNCTIAQRKSSCNCCISCKQRDLKYSVFR